MGKMSGMREVLNTLGEITSAAEKLENSFQTRKDDKKSGRYAYYSQEADRYWKKTQRLLLFSALLWLFFIIMTIVLCMQGNDIILRCLSL